jgi:Tetratricopeptide repeat
MTDPSGSAAPDHLAREHTQHGDRLRAAGNLAAAVAHYRQARVLQPESAEVRIKLAHALKLSDAYGEAAEILTELAAEYPDNLAVAKEFGRLYAAQDRLDDALEQFRQVVQRNPRDADAYHWLANLEHLKGNTQAAERYFRRTVALNPVLRVSAAKEPADFSALLLFSPGNANTPPDTLVKSADYEALFLLVMPGIDYDVAQLRSKAQLVVNLISDVDHGASILPFAADLVDRIGLPVLNHPREILKTDRTSTADRLSGISSCRVPRVRRLAAGQHHTPGRDEYPFLVRVAGTHGGESLARIDSLAAFETFVAAHAAAELYLTEYVDCRSADGFFRKYRFFFIGGSVLPYHLAIHDQWKVHHAATDMAVHAWMRHEEAAFLQDPSTVLSARHEAALHEIRCAVSLDFCGIDCAIDNEGQLIVFEVNASMLVHHGRGLFAYTAPAVDRIKRAFDDLLATRAGR